MDLLLGGQEYIGVSLIITINILMDADKPDIPEPQCRETARLSRAFLFYLKVLRLRVRYISREKQVEFSKHIFDSK